MAMVRQLTEGEIINGGTPEDDSQSSEPAECYGSRPPSRTSSSSSKRQSPTLPALQYSKDELMKLSESPLAKVWPSRLDPAYSNSTGKWDPDRWFMNHRSDRLMPLEEARPKRERLDDGLASHKRKSSDPKERIREEKDDIVLSPQRRSFGTGCHVIQQSSLARRPGSPTDCRDDSYREPSRRIGSGRIISRDRDQRDWDRDREYGYGNRNERRDRFDQDEDKDRRYSGRYNRNERRSRGRDRIDEIEPEWFSGGPTSQSETIELCGFEDNTQDGDNRKLGKKKRKQNSRRSSLKSEEGEKPEGSSHEEKVPNKKADTKQEDTVAIVEVKEADEAQNSGKSGNTGFDLDQLFKMDWIPGLMPNEAPAESVEKDMGCSRFSQWFRKDSPLHDVPESGSNSRRSSLHEELVANVLNSIVEPQIIIPSPTPKASENFFAPISPALTHAPNYGLHPAGPGGSNRDLLEMLQSGKSNSGSGPNRNAASESTKSVKELTADLKRIVLGGEKPHEEKSAFDKLLQHMSDSSNPQTASLSIGPLDKSKALQEQDLLQDMLSGPRQPSPLQQPFQVFEEKQHPPVFRLASAASSTQFSQPSHGDAFAQLLHQKQQHEQQLQQMHQQQMQEQQNHLQPNQPQPQQHAQSVGMQGLTFDMLSKLLNNSAQAPLSPASPGVQPPQGQPVNRNDPSGMNSLLQLQRQQELLSSLLKQQQQQQAMHNLSQQQRMQHLCPSTKDVPLQQTLGLPTLGLSPRQSPMPVEAMVPNTGRIPSPLVFGQQPPALSHAPAPIHPSALVQAVSQNSLSPNTLQVQNPVVLQRVPSPQELAVHTQSILQNALIKRKLEEQKENFRKRQEAQRTNSPITAKNGTSSSPHKGLSPTIAFTPTSVMRKIQSEKTEIKEQKVIQQQNGSKSIGLSDVKLHDPTQGFQKMTLPGLPTVGISSIADANSFPLSSNNMLQQSAVNFIQGPRAVHGQTLSQPRTLHAAMNSAIPIQGRPIVKVGMSQPLSANPDLTRTGVPPNKASMQHNKPFIPGSTQSHPMHHEVDSNFDLINKYTWSTQMGRQPNVAGVQQQLQMAATYGALNRPAMTSHRPGTPLVRPVNIAAAAAAAAGSVQQSSNMNFSLMRNNAQNPIRAGPTASVNNLGQLTNLQMQRGQIDSRQLQALAQTHRIHPSALQQILMNSQNQAAAVQAQVAAGFPMARDGKHLLPGGGGAPSRQSPVNLAKWFGNDVLKQKMPEMPPVTQQKALHVEELERQQQHQSTAVRN